MDLGSGPEETSLNHTTGELSGESSLAGRVELPENRLFEKTVSNTGGIATSGEFPEEAHVAKTT